MGRPRKYATDAERQKAYRDRYAVISVRLRKNTVETLDRIAASRDVPRNELIHWILIKGLVTWDWYTEPAYTSLPRLNPDEVIEPTKKKSGKKLYVVYKRAADGSPVYDVGKFKKLSDAREYAQTWANQTRMQAMIVEKEI